MNDWAPSRTAGLERLAAFLPTAGGDYRRLRNHDLGAGRHGHVSRLSPWIRRRLISEPEVVAPVISLHTLDRAEKFVQEVLWRTYWKGWLEHRPGIWADYLESLDGLRALARGGALQEAEAGCTGIEPFDCWVRELVDTGYLHNHARMWFASIWVFTLELPWALGADFFYRHLLDGDPASNTLSWRWVAGLHTRGKRYLARPGNIEKYTDGRFADVTGLATRAVALEEDPTPAPLAPAPVGIPVDATETGLLITAEDCSLETSEIAGYHMAAVAGGWPTALARDHRLSPRVSDFSRRAVEDALDRAGVHWGAPCAWLDGDTWPASVADWARSAGVRRVIIQRPPCGPWQRHVAGAAEALEAAGISVAWFRRAWDDALYPLARAGFFGFWKKAAQRLPPAPAAS